MLNQPDGYLENKIVKLWITLYSYTMNLIDLIINTIIDKKLKIETIRQVDLHEMEVYGDNIFNAKRYQATPYRLLYKIFKLLDIDCSKYQFIDLGAGKGRVLIMASTFDFKKIIGLEHSPTLSKICIQNIENFNEDNELRPEVEVINIDVVNFDFPASPTVYFLYNPFEYQVLEQVLDKIGPNENNLFIYVNPIRSSLFEKKGHKLINKIYNFNHNRIVHLYSG